MLPAWLVYHPGCSCCLTMFWRLPEKTIYLIFGPIWKFTFMEVLVSFPIKSNTKIFYQKKILGIMKFIMLRKVFLPYRRSEERRVGKECRLRYARKHWKTK